MLQQLLVLVAGEELETCIPSNPGYPALGIILTVIRLIETNAPVQKIALDNTGNFTKYQSTCFVAIHNCFLLFLLQFSSKTWSKVNRFSPNYHFDRYRASLT